MLIARGLRYERTLPPSLAIHRRFLGMVPEMRRGEVSRGDNLQPRQ